eukprot:tig00021135_g18942.t1
MSGAQAIELETKKWASGDAGGFRVRRVNKADCECLIETPEGLSVTITFSDDYKSSAGGQLFVSSDDVDAADFVLPWLQGAIAHCEKPQTVSALLTFLVKTYKEHKGEGGDGNDTEEAEEDDDDGGFDFGDAARKASSQPSPKRARPAEASSSNAKPKELTADMFVTKGGSRVATERLLKDLKAVHHSDAKNYGYDAFPVKDNLYHWRVILFDFEKGSHLEKDLQAYAAKTAGKPEVELEVKFPSDYPFAPPFVRVVKPRFQFHTGHVTVGGSICMELLTKSGWSPGNDIESVIVQIRAEMYNGGARLDPQHAAREYSEQEAQEAFQRVARQHGWAV